MRPRDCFKHAGKVFFKKSVMPVYLVFFITERCNAQCKHCLLGDVASGDKSELTIEEIERLSGTMDDLLFLLLTGGQPFLRPDIAEIVKIFYKNNHVRNVGIPSNGTLAAQTVDSVLDILTSCPDINLSIDISIDAIGPLHDEIRGVPGLFEEAVATYKKLDELAASYRNLSISIATTVSSHNEKQLDKIFEYALGPLKAKNLVTLLTRGNPRNSDAKLFDFTEYEVHARRVGLAVQQGRLAGYHDFPFCDLINAGIIVRSQLIANIARKKEFQLPCFAGRLGVELMSNGDIVPCELLRDKVMGNIREGDFDFKKIWFSDKAEEIRQWISRTRCFCTFECFHTLNILFNVRMYPKLLREWLWIKINRFFATHEKKDHRNA
jgi:MoaA/NifB/PqqE/SkfB family radical SAM enzyme